MSNAEDFHIRHIDTSLHNADLAPLAPEKRKWGWFEIFNVWTNDIQSLFGYTLAATLFISYGLNGWAVLAGIVLAGFIVMGLVQLTGRPSVKYGIPFPVMARSSMGVRGANFPAVVRGIVAIFWYGVQTYFASTALALLITALAGPGSGDTFLGLSAIDWISYVIVCVFQVALFVRGIDWVARFLNLAGPVVYLVMILVMLMIWYQAGPGMLGELGSIFRGTGDYAGGPLAAFFAVVGTMVAYFAAVVINYGDFSRFVKTQKQMTLGNFLGLPVSLTFFSIIALFITAGTVVVFGETLTNPTEIVARVDNLALTVLAALTFFIATVSINLVANFIPPAYDIVDTLGAILAPLDGIMVADYYLIRRQHLKLQELFSAEPGSSYYFTGGWNRKALVAFAIASLFSVASVWMPGLSELAGYGWILGALLGAGLHYLLMRGEATPVGDADAVA
jgi:NCS1 family nucleobase:cation symporter-1